MRTLTRSEFEPRRKETVDQLPSMPSLRWRSQSVTESGHDGKQYGELGEGTNQSLACKAKGAGSKADAIWAAAAAAAAVEAGNRMVSLVSQLARLLRRDRLIGSRRGRAGSSRLRGQGPHERGVSSTSTVEERQAAHNPDVGNAAAVDD